MYQNRINPKNHYPDSLLPLHTARSSATTFDPSAGLPPMYDTLRFRTSQPHRLLFRIYDPTSHSPLIQPSGPPLISTCTSTHQPQQEVDTSMSGFFAPYTPLHLTPEAYTAQFGPLRHGGWARDQDLGESMVSHILDKPIGQLNRRRQELNWSELGEENKSPWISVTRNLDWAIYEVARRLAIGRKEVRMDVIRQISDGSERWPIQQTHILDQSGWRGTYRSARTDNADWRYRDLPIANHSQGLRPWGNTHSAYLSATIKPRADIRGSEVWTQATWEIEGDKATAHHSLHGAFDQAAKVGREKGEVLYWGRIFGGSIVADLKWTKDSTPFLLPSKFIKSVSVSRRHLRTARGWLDLLRWEPLEDCYEMARAAMSDKGMMSRALPDHYVTENEWRWPSSTAMQGMTTQRAAEAYKDDRLIDV